MELDFPRFRRCVDAPGVSRRLAAIAFQSEPEANSQRACAIPAPLRSMRAIDRLGQYCRSPRLRRFRRVHFAVGDGRAHDYASLSPRRLRSPNGDYRRADGDTGKMISPSERISVAADCAIYHWFRDIAAEAEISTVISFRYGRSHASKRHAEPPPPAPPTGGTGREWSRPVGRAPMSISPRARDGAAPAE